MKKGMDPRPSPKELLDDEDALLVAEHEVVARDDHVSDGHMDALHRHVFAVDGIEMQSQPLLSEQNAAFEQKFGRKPINTCEEPDACRGRCWQ